MPQSREGIDRLTEVQARCLRPGIAGRDILARSNTGSGKTLAFLVVAVERILRHGSPDPWSSFPVVVMTPVTDLARQIADVARELLAHHSPMRADVVTGGTSEQADVRRLAGDRIDILVVTPGRFKSLLNHAAIRRRLERCQTFVIDEADKLTDAGFLRDTRAIHAVARSGNARLQTLMFSATLDRDAVMRTGLLASDAEYIEVLSHDKSIVNTKVTQNVVVCPLADSLDAVVSVVRDAQYMQRQRGGAVRSLSVLRGARALSDGTLRALETWRTPSMSGYRIMCFLPSNAYIDYFAKAFAHVCPDVTSLVLHGGLAQHKRAKVTDAFRATNDCVLFTSDASARGVDYADVTCVVQLGFDSRSEYLQRVGRTGRAGKSGTAFLIIAPEEVEAAAAICDVVSCVYSTSGKMCGRARSYEPDGLVFPMSMARDAKGAYRGWLGALASKWKRLRMHRADVMEMAQQMAVAMRLGRQDPIRLADKLHLV